MSDTKSERLGVRGTLGLFESALRLVGGANATGAIASGAAVHAFAQNLVVQSSLKTSTILFLFGILSFAIAYGAWFITKIQMELWLSGPDEKRGPEKFLISVEGTRNPEQLQKSSRIHFIISALSGIVSFALFLSVLGYLIATAITLEVD